MKHRQGTLRICPPPVLLLEMLEARVEFEPSDALEKRKLFIPLFERTDRNPTNAELGYTAGTLSRAVLGSLSTLAAVLLFHESDWCFLDA